MNTTTVLLSALIVTVIMLVAAGALWRWLHGMTRVKAGLAELAGNFGDPLSSLQAMADTVRVAAHALICMPSLDPRQPVALRWAATFLGWDAFTGTPLWEQHENSKLITAAPRTGKTQHLVRRYVADAPGPCAVTSTRGEITDLADERVQLGEWAAVFDPGGAYDGPLPRVRWDPISGCEQPRTAMARAAAIVSGADASASDGDNHRFFQVSATIVLQCLLHAAAIGGRSMKAVVDWASDFTNPEPLAILNAPHGAARGWGKKLQAQVSGDAHVTVDSTRKTVVNALKIFDDPEVLELCCPPAGESMDLAAFVTAPGRPLLAIISDPGADGASAAPITTALCAALMSTAKRISQQPRHWPWSTPAGSTPGKPTRRLSPCLRFVGDEYCNIAPIPDTHELMSDSGGRGIELIVIAQNRDQLLERFGRDAGNAIRAAANLKIYLGGSTDVDELDELSQLLGDREVEVTSVTRTRRGEKSVNTHHRDRRVLTIGEIRELEDGRALVFYKNRKAALVDIADLNPHTGLMSYRPTPEVVVTAEKLADALSVLERRRLIRGMRKPRRKRGGHDVQSRETAA